MSVFASFRFVFTLMVASLIGIGVAQGAGDRRIIISKSADYFGGDYKTFKNISLSACQKSCLADNSCKAFTYNQKAKWCFLKNSVGELKSFKGAIAGQVVETKKPEPVPELAKADRLDFLNSSFARYLITYEKAIIERFGKTAVSDENARRRAHFAERNGDMYNSYANYVEASAINPKSVSNWLNLARVVLVAKPKDNNQKRDYNKVARHASLKAYQLSRTTSDRAEALAYLAQALSRNSYYRPALQSYKASLALVDSRVHRDAFSKLRAARGFRVVEHSVNADTAAPRICIQFSENLIKTTDYSTFISVDGKIPNGLDVEQQQLCVNGVTHGKRYRISLRSGLPGNFKEVLQNAATLNIFVRDRKAFVRFNGTKFVLPRIGTKGIPVVSVNTRKVDVSLYRIGERGLNRAISRRKFLKAQSKYSLSTIEEEMGTKVWSGTMDIAPVLNKEVTTSFPVQKALPKREPGVYVLVASPVGDKTDEWNTKATQWFVVSDIGLSTMSGNDGLHVFARSLSSGEPLAGVEIQLLTHSNEELGNGKTDAKGYAKLDAGLLRGFDSMAPGLVLARLKDTDFVMVDLRKSAIDLSDRGVTGRDSPGPLDAFMYTERGIYRPGETVHVTTLLRDNNAVGVKSVPLTIDFVRPDGKTDASHVVSGSGEGGHSYSFKLQSNAMQGAWNVRAYADPDGVLLAEKKILVEDFIPDRIEFDLTSPAKAVSRDKPTRIDVAGRYLYGAPAVGADITGTYSFSSTHKLESYKGFVFGLDDQKSAGKTGNLEGWSEQNAEGKSSLEINSSILPTGPGLFEAYLNVQMSEDGGRAVERSISLPIAPAGNVIGIKPSFKGGSVPEGSSAGFEIIAVDRDGKQMSMTGLKWSVVKLNRNYQWYSSDGGWNYEAVLSTKKVAAGTIDANSDGKAIINTMVDWGRYRLQVSAGDDGPVSSVTFNGGWYVENASTETPDGLEMALDKNVYKPGDVAVVKISPRFSGKAQITVGAETLLWTKYVEVAKSGATVEIPVKAEWGAGAYVNVTLYRPGDTKASRMPSRAIGIKWLKVDPGARNLQVNLDLPRQTTPRKAFEVPVQIAGLKAGENAYVTIAAVDVGILNLTYYTPPKPGNWYFGQRKLGLELHDVYGKLIDGYAGVVGRIRSGGDGPAEGGSKGSPPTQKLISFYSGIVKVDGNGRANVSFDMPQFNGTVRVMAVAWTKSGVGDATADVIVRDPIVLTATVPRFLSPGDVTTLRLDIANTDGPAGDYQLTVETFGKLGIDLPSGGMTVTLAKGEKKAVIVPVRGLQVGDGVLSINFSRTSGPSVDQALAVPVRAPQLPISRRQIVRLAKNGGQLQIDKDFIAGYLPNSTSMTLGVSRAAGLDVPSLLTSLNRYPYGCAEQTTSKALPLLYLSDVATQSGLGDDPAIRKRVQGAIARVVGFQAAAGSFGMWSPGSDNLWLDSYVTDFLTRAREKGYKVPVEAMTLALENLQNSLSYDINLAEQSNEIAYALYVLARNKRASIGDLRYYVNSKLEEFVSPLAKAQLAAALGLYGEQLPSAKAFNAAFVSLDKKLPENFARDSYGSKLRDRAAILALAAEARPAMSFVPALLSKVSSARLAKTYTTTQENSWMLLAARALFVDGKKISLSVNGQDHVGNLARKLSATDINGGLVVANRSDENLDAVITVTGVPSKALPAGGQGFEIEREYYTRTGEKIDPSKVAQNERFVVVLTIKEHNDLSSRIVVTDLLPAGFEIENPRLLVSANLSGMDWLKNPDAAHTEFHHDRFVAAFNRSSSDDREIMLAYMVRAVSPGKYVHPAATVEDMYRPHLSARTGQASVEVVGPKP